MYIATRDRSEGRKTTASDMDSPFQFMFNYDSNEKSHLRHVFVVQTDLADVSSWMANTTVVRGVHVRLETGVAFHSTNTSNASSPSEPRRESEDQYSRPYP
jgi:hypothetical protein